MKFRFSSLKSGIIDIYTKCQLAEAHFLCVLLSYFVIRIYYGKNILKHHKATIIGINNIECKKQIAVGLGYVGFMHHEDRTLLRVNGRITFKGNYSIGRGCRFDIGKNAVVSVGSGGFINCNSIVIIMHKLFIGDNCAISWNCQFLDEDFHTITYEGKKQVDNSITIGNNVWIGSGVKVYRGTKIPDGCVIASDSVVRGAFLKENCLIGGNPAKVIRENVSWN